MNEKNETKVTLTIYSNCDKSKIFNSPDIKHNTVKVSLKVFYTSIEVFHASIHATFRHRYEKHEPSKGLCGASPNSR